MELSALEKLDTVLRFINDKQKPPKSTLLEIKTGISAILNESDTVLLQIIGRLEKDHFIKVEHDIINEIRGSSSFAIPTSVTYYLISFDGAYLLKHQDGYVGRENQRHAENIRLDAVEAYQRGQADTLNRLTSLVAWGTIAASAIAFLLLLWEVRHAVLRIWHHIFL